MWCHPDYTAWVLSQLISRRISPRPLTLTLHIPPASHRYRLPHEDSEIDPLPHWRQQQLRSIDNILACQSEAASVAFHTVVLSTAAWDVPPPRRELLASFPSCVSCGIVRFIIKE